VLGRPLASETGPVTRVSEDRVSEDRVSEEAGPSPIDFPGGVCALVDETTLHVVKYPHGKVVIFFNLVLFFIFIFL
jgi:hypothetical protein